MAPWAPLGPPMNTYTSECPESESVELNAGPQPPKRRKEANIINFFTSRNAGPQCGSLQHSPTPLAGAGGYPLPHPPQPHPGPSMPLLVVISSSCLSERRMHESSVSAITRDVTIRHYRTTVEPRLSKG